MSEIRRYRRFASLLVFAFGGLAPSLLSAGHNPDYEWAYQHSDLVVLGQVQATSERIQVRVTQVLKGKHSGSLILRRPTRVVMHAWPRQQPGTQLLFLRRSKSGFGMVPVPDCSGGVPLAAVANFRLYFRTLDSLPAVPELRTLAERQQSTLLRIAFDEQDSEARLAHAALRSLLRRPAYLALARSSDRQLLRTLSATKTKDLAVRAAALSCLLGARDPLLTTRIAETLLDRSAAALGAHCGGLLRASLGSACLPILQALAAQGGTSVREPVLIAIQATGLIEGKRWLSTLATQPRLAGVVRRARAYR